MVIGSGCSFLPKKSQNDSERLHQQAREKLDTAEKHVASTSSDIIKQSDDGETRSENLRLEIIDSDIKTPDRWAESLSEISKLFVSIKSDAVSLLDTVADLKESRDHLEYTQDRLDQKIEENTKLVEKIDRLQDDNIKNLYTLLGILIITGVVGMGVAGFIFMYGAPKIAVGIAVGCAIVVATSVGLIQYSWIAALAGSGLIVVLSIGVVVYYLRKNRNALEEVVFTTEEAKNRLDERSRSEVFGVSKASVTPKAAVADSVQSPSTVKLVKSIRQKQKLGQ